MTLTNPTYWRAVALAVCMSSLAAASPTAAQLTVIRVIDGDTFVLSDDRRVRLIGIDAPETRLPRDDGRSEADRVILRQLAARSTDHLGQLVADRTIELEFDPASAATNHLDRYGRTLAYVWVIEDGRRSYMANRQMVADGFANAYTTYPFRYADEFLELQRVARERGRGLWANDVRKRIETLLPHL